MGSPAGGAGLWLEKAEGVELAWWGKRLSPIMHAVATGGADIRQRQTKKGLTAFSPCFPPWSSGYGTFPADGIIPNLTTSLILGQGV